MIIKAAKMIFNCDKICCSYSDLNFGVTFLEHSVEYYYLQLPCNFCVTVPGSEVRNIVYVTACLPVK